MLSKKVLMIAHVLVLVYALYVAIVTVLDDMSEVWKKIVSIIVGLAAGWLLFQRDTYLPFLGEAVFPATAIIDERTPEGANTEVKIRLNVPDGTKVIYWGAEPSKQVISNPWDAYGKYGNTGVAVVNGGQVTMKVRCPAEYKVMGGHKKLKRHIHYRTCCTRNAMMGAIETVHVEC